MENIFTASAEPNLQTWTEWLRLLAWLAGLIATLGFTWWASRGVVVALGLRYATKVIERLIVAAGGLVASATLLTFSPLPLGFTLIAAALALVLAAAGVGFSLVGYNHFSDVDEDYGIPTGARIVELQG